MSRDAIVAPVRRRYRHNPRGNRQDSDRRQRRVDDVVVVSARGARLVTLDNAV